MPNIRPVSDLRNYAEVLKEIAEKILQEISKQL